MTGKAIPSTEVLRQAADRLDALAGAATSGPWAVHPSIATAVIAVFPVVAITPETRPTDADYIAAMHPGVGKALAAWLRAERQNCRESAFFADCTLREQEDFIATPLAVARAVLSGAS